MNDRILICEDANVDSLRKKYPGGLHFVIGDLHGEVDTLKKLIEKIGFNPEIDHAYFVGDYNAGGNPRLLLDYMSQYYQADYDKPGFHMIRGNHERELLPIYPLENLPDIIVYKSRVMTYYFAHAGMITDVFELINKDMDNNPGETNYAYALDEPCAGEDRPFRQVVWSRKGLYSQRSRYHVWPSEESLKSRRACIIHGHTPYAFMKQGGYFSYGDEQVFFGHQHMWFSEDLQSFNIDSNVKGRYVVGEDYRGLSCVCLEVIDEIAEENGGFLTVDSVKSGERFVVSEKRVPVLWATPKFDLLKILDAQPRMKKITIDINGEAIVDSVIE